MGAANASEAPSDLAALKEEIVAKARAIGFNAVRVAPAALDAHHGESLDRYVAEERHGGMDWMALTPERRRTPRGLWPEARSILVLGTNYGPAEDPMRALARQDRGNISVYARNKDYHDLVKKRLKELGRWIGQRTGTELKVFVDTAPVLEKPLAEAAGLGWRGKHTCVVSREFGSWLFLSEIYLAIELPPDAPAQDRCGGCRRCLDICPTDAFTGPREIDARRCLSYLSIEHKGPIPVEFRAAMGNRIYGCDDCLAICPWNKFAKPTGEESFLPRAELTAPRLADLSQLNEADFRQVFSGSPVKRIGRDRFLRNVLIALGNSGDTRLAPFAERQLADGSPLVRGMAVWALDRLDPARLVAGPPADEADEEVLAEWRRAFSPAEDRPGLIAARGYP